MTATELIKAMDVLLLLENATMEQLKDPRFVGNIQAGAFCARIALRQALGGVEIEVKKSSCEPSQC